MDEIRVKGRTISNMGLLRPLGYLPNKVGFAFLGVRPDGSTVDCVVAKDGQGMHRVGGGATYGELAGWLPNPK